MDWDWVLAGGMLAILGVSIQAGRGKVFVPTIEGDASNGLIFWALASGALFAGYYIGAEAQHEKVSDFLRFACDQKGDYLLCDRFRLPQKVLSNPG
ncbi:hypothetical protein D3C78_1339290 [compost metagenome]